MKLGNVNKVFRRLAVFQLKHRLLFVPAIIILTIVGATGLTKVRAIAGEDDFIKPTEKDKQDEEKFGDLFGNNDHIVLLIEADDVFAPEVLRTIHEIGNELLDNLPYADSLTSITDMDITVGTDAGLEITNPFSDGIPDDFEELQKAKEFILSRKSIVNKLVSKDAKETWVIVSLKPYPPIEVWSKTDKIEPMFQDGQKAIEIVTSDKYKSDTYTIKPAGLPYTETEEEIVTNYEIAKTVSIGFVLMVILLIIFSKSLRGTVVPIFSIVAAIVTVFGFMGHLNITVYSTMASLPIVLSMALSVGYSIHLINSFRHYFYIIGNRKEAVILSVENTGWPLLFTVITTAVSVLSFLTTDLNPIRWVGVTCASTVIAVYLYVAILIPILLSFGKDGMPAEKKAVKEFKKLDLKFQALGQRVIKKRKRILAVFSIITLACIPALFMIEVNMDSFKFMGLRIPYIKRIWEITQSQLGSYFNYNVMLTFDEPDAIKDPDTLRKVDELSDLISSFKYTKKTDGVAKIFSVLDVVKEMNQAMHSDDEAYYKIPESQELLTQLLFLYDISGGDMSRWVDEEYQTLRLNVDLVTFNGNEIVSNLNTIEETCKKLFPKAECFLVGPAVRFAEINNKIVIGELTSFLASLVAIAFLMILVFGSFKMGVIGLIPNLMPLITIGGIMGYLRIPLDMMTMTIMPMILGIAVDDTIHFTNHLKFVFEKDRSYSNAIDETFYSIGKTLAMTTIILSVTFLSYVSCKIDAILWLGILSSVGLLSALVADYCLTPILIYLTKPFGKESEPLEKDEVKN